MFFFPKRTCEVRKSSVGCTQCSVPGIIEGTAVRAASGWRSIEKFESTDQWEVLSGGHRRASNLGSRIVWRDTVSCPANVRPLIVPEGALGNDEHVWVQQETRLVFDSAPFTDLVDATHVSIKAADLVGIRGIEIADEPPTAVRVYQVIFDDAEAVQIAGGLWQLCAAPCNSMDLLSDDSWDLSRIGRNTVRHLTADEAVMFFGALDAALVHHKNRPIRDMFF